MKVGVAKRYVWRWIAGGLLLAIYLSLYPVQFLLDALRERGLLRLTVGAAFVLVALGVVAALIRRRAGARAWLVLLAFAVLYVVLLRQLPVVQERFHLLEYGVLALALRRAWSEGLAARWWGAALARRAAFAALLTAAAAGWGDELVQALLPNRVYDLRDVGFNALAAALALGAEAAAGWTGEREVA